ncbi:Small GTP-binding protein domain [Trinorchestia longiramus]|nr:Small GTP-binding protein domain [Trinorchestia longiramus]
MGRSSRVVVTGLKAVGKTSLLECAIYGNSIADREYIPTLEDTYVCSVETDRGTKEKLRFYDTAGLDLRAPKSLNAHLHGIADAYLLVYSTQDMNSLQAIMDVKKDIDKHRDKKDAIIVVVACRSDGRVSPVREAGERWAASERLRHCDVSLTNRASLVEPLAELASRLTPQPSKTSLPQFYMVGRKSKE